jgi:chorismate mutase
MKANIENTALLTNQKKPILIAGPCSAETEQQVITTAKSIAAVDKNIIYRAGIWKPRTRPNAFEGIGRIGLNWLQKVTVETGLRTATEVATAEHVEECLRAGIHLLWIGARTTVNPFSVQEIAEALRGTDIPVLVKNPVTPDLQLWIGAFERLYKCGVTRLGAIHRGFHSHNITPFRNDPMWNLAIDLKTSCPDLPIICDPSHICGSRELIPYIAQKAMDMDMQGLMIETHCMPDIAWSDAKQQITPSALKQLLDSLVIRKSRPSEPVSVSQLDSLRNRIDKTDDELLHLLMNRMKVSEQIGTYKRTNNITILQSNRWEELLSNRMEAGAIMGLSEDFVRQLYLLIHEESIRKQDAIMNLST